MLTLKEFITHDKGTYVSAILSDTSKHELGKFVVDNVKNADHVDPNTYHTTIIYSRSPVPSAEKYSGKINQHGKIVGYELFDTKDGSKCLVAKVDFPYGTQLNELLMKSGATSDYDSYRPHITLCYPYTGSSDIESIPVPNIDIVYDMIDVQPLDEDYTPPSK